VAPGSPADAEHGCKRRSRGTRLAGRRGARLQTAQPWHPARRPTRSTAANGAAVAPGSPADADGNVLALDSSSIILAGETIEAGNSTDITTRLAFAEGVADGEYTGLLTVTGRDAVTGDLLTKTIHLSVTIDRTGPAAPQIAVAPGTGGTRPVSVQGTTDPNLVAPVLRRRRVHGRHHRRS